MLGFAVQKSHCRSASTGAARWRRALAAAWLLLAALGVLCSCERTPQTASRSGDPTAQQVFQVNGVVVSVKPREKTVEIKHETIPNYMPGMTMPFEVKDTNELAGLAPGDPVSFRLTVTDTEGWIDQIKKIAASTNGPAPRPSVVVIKDVPRLDVGEVLPEYRFTNQFGQAFSTTDFKGQALAITFLFTRCPYPTFCPRMANNFEEVQQKLLTESKGATNWHLLTISFDPDFDKPGVLKAYAEAHQYKPEHWTFATGAIESITTIGEQFGLEFFRNDGSITHNLRTIVIDARGRVRKVFEGNEWASGELVEVMEEAVR